MVIPVIFVFIAEFRQHREECTIQPFNHPIWVVYSSGTTGLPKPLVHGHGGILLEFYKFLMLHMDY